MSTYILCPDTLIHFREGKNFLSNPKTKTHVHLNNGLGIIEKFNKGATKDEWVAALQTAQGKDATQSYFGEYGLHTDHTGIDPNFEELQEVKTGQSLFNLLTDRWLLVNNDLLDYSEYFKPLSSILDRSHIGTFHQRVGQYLTIKKRLHTERWRWWHDQKFLNDGKQVKPGPYHFIQENYINEYFSKEELNGLTVLDFGCGNGFYSAKLASLGAKVIGIDLSQELIQLATKNFGEQANFYCFENSDDSLAFLRNHKNSFDMLFMQDVLLLLINPEKPSADQDTLTLLKTLRETLKPDGKLFTMEPNASFWLAGRYGSSKQPYAIVTEYQQQVFNVAPTLSKIVSTMKEAGFALIEYKHPSCSDTENQNYSYANNFCIWDFMTFIPIK